ncbi:hypothetical protein SASPL_117970 [Salvia splendens]|uniref:Uncharacterized protein n=1 Tax=Salvia splendens TaxID=180675 RepID=A0A8X8XWI2_SALSN|nr:hypothetical protein SASPL_117970 [Salvia splendens]
MAKRINFLENPSEYNTQLMISHQPRDPSVARKEKEAHMLAVMGARTNSSQAEQEGEPEDEVEHSGGYGGGDYEERECGEGEAAAPPALSAAREGFELRGILRRRMAEDLGVRSDWE